MLRVSAAHASKLAPIQDLANILITDKMGMTQANTDDQSDMKLAAENPLFIYARTKLEVASGQILRRTELEA